MSAKPGGFCHAPIGGIALLLASLRRTRHVEILNVMPYVYSAVAFVGVVGIVFVSLVALQRALG
jgi:hypothetical protein